MTSSQPQGPEGGAKKPRAPRAARPMRLSVGAQEFIKKGLPRFDLQDPYYFAVSLNWRKFALLFVAAELTINCFFAGLYTLQPNAIANQPLPGFFSAFFFSLETLATVGYGEMYPGSTYGHIVSSLEILTGTVFTAIMTGLLFIRFSKPRAKVLYATNAVVTLNNGRQTLMLRIGNARTNVLHNVTLTIHMLSRTISNEGQRQANIIELPLVRPRLPIFAILFTMMHVIDEASPLSGLELDSDAFDNLRFFVNVGATDPAIGQDVSDFHTFAGSDIRFGMRYVDAVQSISDTQTIADYGLLSRLEPDTGSKVRQGEV